MTVLTSLVRKPLRATRNPTSPTSTMNHDKRSESIWQQGVPVLGHRQTRCTGKIRSFKKNRSRTSEKEYLVGHANVTLGTPYIKHVKKNILCARAPGESGPLVTSNNASRRSKCEPKLIHDEAREASTGKNYASWKDAR